MRMVLNEAEALSKLLSHRVYDKVTVYQTGAECTVLVARRGETIHLIALARRDDWLYAKIALGDALPTTAWSCENIFYTPYGLYAFGRSVEEVAEKIIAKQPRLKAQERLLEEARRKGLPLEE